MYPPSQFDSTDSVAQSHTHNRTQRPTNNGIAIGGESWHTCRVSSDYKQSVVQLSGRLRRCSRAFFGSQQNLEACSEDVCKGWMPRIAASAIFRQYSCAQYSLVPSTASSVQYNSATKKASQNYEIDIPLTFECIRTGMSRTPKNRRSKKTVPASIYSAHGIDTVQQATTSYERWMSSCTTMLPTDLRLKHQQMKTDPFLFLRGTFYRWAQMWSQVGGDLCNAPQVLAVGDLHVDSFGTWRDLEGRMCWGVDDFDEAYPLPYTNDLVRLAVSIKIVADAGGLNIALKDGCDAILEGYRESLTDGGHPIVLAEHEPCLEKLGIQSLKQPDDFWEKLNQLPVIRHGLPKNAKQVLEKALPDPKMEYRVVRREAGLGSLGQQRFVAIANWKGGFLAREAKAMVPSACSWLEGPTGHHRSYYEEVIRSAVRSHDPYQSIVGSWLVRRLSPDSNPIEIMAVPKRKDEETFLRVMGTEAANVHVGSKQSVKKILRDMDGRKSNWLRDAAKPMARMVERDWKQYRKR